MKIYEFGKEHTRSFAMFQCAVEPWWVFKASAEEMAKDYHVYLFIADGHDELGTEFESLEKFKGRCIIFENAGHRKEVWQWGLLKTFSVRRGSLKASWEK